WSLNGANIAGATASTLSIGPLAFANYGTYQVAVDDGGYTTLSAKASVLPPLPALLTQPASRAALQGTTISPAFSVVVDGCSPRTNYQWYSNNVAIARGTNATLNLTNVQTGSFTPNFFYVTVNDALNALST